MKKLIILAFVIIIGIVGFICIQKRKVQSENQIDTYKPNNTQNQNASDTPPGGAPILSTDKKSIIADGKILLSIDNDSIFNWFKTESQLCDSHNITTTADRKSFCDNKSSFKNLTRFSSIIVSPDKTKIGFAITSNTLSPDSVVGIFNRSTNKVSLLTSYYLENEFISFSPNGTNFVYKGGCFEGMCGLFIKNSETLSDKASLNNPERADERGQDAVFIRWISDNQVEYKIGTELKNSSF